MALITLAGIAEAVANLHLNEATLKGQLLQAICSRFTTEETLDQIPHIDPLDLIHELWAPTSPAEIKAKRKNLSSLKSSLNKSLKDGITSGANPEGIIIGRDNVFIIADEKKDLLLDKLDSDGTASLLSALATLNDLLTRADTPSDKGQALNILKQLDTARKTLSRLAGLPDPEADAPPGPAAEPLPADPAVEEFEIDADTVIEFIDEEELPTPAAGSTVAGGKEDTSEGMGPEPVDDGESLEVVEEDDLDLAATDTLADQEDVEIIDDGERAIVEEVEEVPAGGEMAGESEAAAVADDWESFEVVEEDDLDLAATDTLADQEDVEIIDDGERAIVEEVEEVPAGGEMAGEAGAAASADDWESFEVVEEEDLDLAAADSLADQEDIEIIDDEEMATVEEVEEVPAAEEMAGEAEAAATADDWESFEVVEEEEDIDLAAADSPADQEDIEIIDDEEMATVEEVEEVPAAAEMVGESKAAAAADDWESFEVVEEDDLDLAATDTLADQEDIEILDDEERSVVEEVEELPTAGELAGESKAAAAADDWESFEVVEEDDLDLAATDPLADQEDAEISDDGERSVVEEVEDLPGNPADTPGPALARSMDLSHYIEAEEALAAIPEVLQEKNEAYVQQVLERFMPKFIKIPAGLYPVGGDKKRRTDRAAATVRLPSFYIGQLPITNDLFDFFVRETGYQTEAEQHGHGLVTVGRLRRDVQQKTGRHTLAVSQGVITRQLKGASWRHPDGPDSSLENRGHHPVVQVSRQDAMAFAAWAGKRLPSEDEWEAAARGKEGFLLPWGNEFLPLANLEGLQTGTTTPVTFFGRESVSPFGLLDMVGNVFEWTSSTYRGHGKGELVILKGGSWATARARCADRLIEPATTWANTIGFRCAVDGG